MGKTKLEIRTLQHNGEKYVSAHDLANLFEANAGDAQTRECRVVLLNLAREMRKK